MSTVTKEELKRCEAFLKKCIKHLRKKEFELHLPPETTKIALRCFNVKRTNHRHACGRAGANVIIVNFNYWQKDNPVFKEYDAYNDSPVIGAKEMVDDFDYMRVQIAHELAHHIQYRYCKYIGRFRKSYSKPHGVAFMYVYRILRQGVVNQDQIANQF